MRANRQPGLRRASPVGRPAAFLARFRRNARGNVAIMFAIALPLLLGFGALVVDYGNGLVMQANNQRVADLAAYAGALAYSADGSEASMRSAARATVNLNGLEPDTVAVDLVASPRTAGAKAVRAFVAGSNPLFLAPILGISPSQRVTTVAYAELAAQVAGCVLALDGAQSGITLNGGTSISAPSCSVDSNAGIAVPCGTTITAKAVTYNSAAAPSQPCGGIATAQLSKGQTADPMAGNAALALLEAHLAQVATMTIGAPPGVPSGPSINFGYDQPSTIAAAKAAGCAATLSGNVWTLTCPVNGAYTFGDISVAGGISVSFNTAGSPTSTYNIGGNVSNGGSALRFGPGTYNIARGIRTGGGSTTSFGAGTFSVGRDAMACNGGGYYSVCNNGTLSFAGPSAFVFWAGLANGGGSTLTVGSGSSNSFSIGPASNGTALTLGGGSRTYLADATGPASRFQLVGNIDAGGGGGCLMLGAAAQHDIAGSLDSTGAVILGAGVYSLDGYFALGANGGGASACNGSTVSLSAPAVTLVLSGRSTPISGGCSGAAFCIGAGYGNAVLSAPASGTTANMAVIGPLSSSTAGATFTEGGAGGQIAGLLYFPRGPISMNGGATLSGGSACLQLVGSRIAMAGGALLASACFGSSGSGPVRLVQ